MKKIKLPGSAVFIAVMSIVSLNLCSCSKKAGDDAKKSRLPVNALYELEKVKDSLKNKNTPSAIGIGISGDEMIARHISADEARAQLSRAVEGLSGSTVYKSISKFDDETKSYRVYTLVASTGSEAP